MIANTASNLQVRNLKRVVSERLVISDISFDLGPGEILFIRGPSGVGKTLLLRCIATLDPIQVCFKDQAISSCAVGLAQRSLH